MIEKISQFVDFLSEFFAARKGLLPILGLLFIMINFVMVLLPEMEFFKQTNTFLHIGVFLAILGLMLAKAL